MNNKTVSYLTEQQSIEAVRELASRMLRQNVSNESFSVHNTQCNSGEVLMKILVTGTFINTGDFTEAMRVLGGHVLPKQENQGGKENG